MATGTVANIREIGSKDNFRYHQAQTAYWIGVPIIHRKAWRKQKYQ